MHPHRTVDITIALSDRLHRRSILRTDANAQKVPDAPRPGSIQSGIQRALAGSKVEAIKVTMGIYKHGCLFTEVMEKSVLNAEL
ncbi:hypothetical protein GCM10009504_42450 [Pseudomonas laurentiana]|nr:hypothetical protein GCM10009504_42450 [Pseudomonas laurentiana]